MSTKDSDHLNNVIAKRGSATATTLLDVERVEPDGSGSELTAGYQVYDCGYDV